MSIDLTTELTRIDEYDETHPDHPKNKSAASPAEYDNAYVETATVENMEPIETIVADEVVAEAPDREDEAMKYDERSPLQSPGEAAASLHSTEAILAAETPDSVPPMLMADTAAADNTDDESFIDSAQDTWQSLQTGKSAEYFDRAKAYVIDFFNTNRQLLVALGVVFLGIISLKLLFAGLNAIDDIPLVAPLLNVIGLFCTVRFVWRYLIREQDRQELLEAIDRVKMEIFGN
jgi:hypothetical protein